MNRLKNPEPLLEMKDLQFFLERIEKRTTEGNEHLGECWIWTGAKNKKGRAVYCDRSQENRNRISARDIYETVHNITLPKGRKEPICHRCKKQYACINPDHLYRGTSQSNRLDAVNQKQIPLQKKMRGKEQMIIDLFQQGVEQQEIAKRIGVCRATITRFLNGQTNQQGINYVKQAEEQRDTLIKKLFEEGKSVTQIAVLAKTVDTVIYKVVPEIRLREKGKETIENKSLKVTLPIPERNSQIKLLRQQGTSVRVIAEQFNISIPLVYTILRQV